MRCAMSTEAQRRAWKKYNQAHSRQFSIKLHKERDADILEALENVKFQTYVKDLIRKDIRKNK